MTSSMGRNNGHSLPAALDCSTWLPTNQTGFVGRVPEGVHVASEVISRAPIAQTPIPKPIPSGRGDYEYPTAPHATMNRSASIVGDGETANLDAKVV
jgi:hypothetical protein